MPKGKTKEWVNTIFSLNPDIKQKIKEIAEFEGISRTELVEFLVNNWDAGIDPTNKLSMLIDERKRFSTQLSEIDLRIEEVTRQIKIFDEWKKHKSQKKEQALNIIKRVILDKDFERAELISKTWQKITGIPATQLLFESMENIKKSGV